MFRYRGKYSFIEMNGVPIDEIISEEYYFVAENIVEALSYLIQRIETLINKEKLFKDKTINAVINEIQLVGEFIYEKESDRVIEVRYFNYTIPEKDSFNNLYINREEELKQILIKEKYV